MIDAIGSGQFSQGDTELFRPLVDSLLERDEYLLLVDFAAYMDCSERAAAAFQDRDAWTRMSILNAARSGFFSSDRTIRQYSEEIGAFNLWRSNNSCKPYSAIIGTTASVICRLEDSDYEGHSLAMLRRIAGAVPNTPRHATAELVSVGRCSHVRGKETPLHADKPRGGEAENATEVWFGTLLHGGELRGGRAASTPTRPSAPSAAICTPSENAPNELQRSDEYNGTGVALRVWPCSFPHLQRQFDDGEGMRREGPRGGVAFWRPFGRDGLDPFRLAERVEAHQVVVCERGDAGRGLAKGDASNVETCRLARCRLRSRRAAPASSRRRISRRRCREFPARQRISTATASEAQCRAIIWST